MDTVYQNNVSNWILSYQNRLSEETLMKDAFYNFKEDQDKDPYKEGVEEVADYDNLGPL